MSLTPLEHALLQRCTFPSVAHVFCAVSGGADSLALLILARAAGLDVTVVHVDHGLRAESAGELQVVAAAAQRFGAKFEARQAKVEPGPNLEARARTARYGALPEAALTGHTLDDQAETVVLNLLRGAGLDGLSGMRVERHPLLAIRRAETHALCAELGVEPVQDLSNTDPSFRRNRVRHELLPLMASVAERDVAQVIARQAHWLRDDAELLDQLATSLQVADAKALAAAPLPLARRAVRQWVRALSPDQHPPSQAEIDRVLEVAGGAAVSCELSGGWRVKRTDQRLYLEPQVTDGA